MRYQIVKIVNEIPMRYQIIKMKKVARMLTRRKANGTFIHT